MDMIVKPKKKNRIRTELRLIEAGIAAFSRYGFDGATTKKISQVSGVNESLIIRYFGSKQGLLLAIIDRIFSSVISTDLHYPPCDNLESELISYLIEEMRFFADQHKLWKIILTRSWSDSKIMKKFKESQPRIDSRLLERLKLLQKNNKIRSDSDLEELCMQAGIQGVAIHILRDNEISGDGQKIQTARFFANAIANGLCPH